MTRMDGSADCSYSINLRRGHFPFLGVMVKHPTCLSCNKPGEGGEEKEQTGWLAGCFPLASGHARAPVSARRDLRCASTDDENMVLAEEGTRGRNPVLHGAQCSAPCGLWLY